ncbi:hypothetical protein ACFWBI_07835 [Streptomyces sp. NPDC059982]|uniref:hypothetical protein n=1 Tax=unclassified Streptomyces TaxID=2593676 RepID=UPI0036966382
MRYLFGGTADAAAETSTGARLPGSTGTVWNSAAPDAQQLIDLIDTNGNPLSMLTADKNGMVPPFFGPDGVRYVWADFGAGRYMLLPTDTRTVVDEHTQGLDPHGDRAYANSLFDRAIPRTGATLTVDAKKNLLTAKVPSAADSTGSVLRVSDGATTFTRILNNGTVVIDTVGAATPLALGTPAGQATGNLITAVNGKASAAGTGSVFTVRTDGSVIATGTVTAKNIGGSRVFSGTQPPDNPQMGDVWIQFG